VQQTAQHEEVEPPGAQFGGRLLVPVSEAMLARFVENFRELAAARASATEISPTPAPLPHARESGALARAWELLSGWLRGLFGREPH